MVLPSDEPKVGAKPQEPGQEPAVKPTEPEYITKEELVKFEGSLKEILAKNFQAVQSQTDRYQSRVQEKVGEVELQLKGLQDRGLEISDAQIKQYSREAAIDSLLEGQEPAAQPDETPGQEPAEGDGKDDGFTTSINAAAQEMEKTIGITLDEKDPEYQEIIKHVNDANPLNYLRAVETALKTKKERVDGALPARMPSLSSGGQAVDNPIADTMNADDLWAAAKREGKV